MENHNECAERLRLAARMLEESAEFCYLQVQAAAKDKRPEDRTAFGAAYRAVLRSLMELDDAVGLLRDIEKRKSPQ